MTTVPQPRQAESLLPVDGFIDGSVLAEVLELAWATFVDPEAVLIPVGPVEGEPGLVAEVAVHGEAPARITLAIDSAGARAVTERMVFGAAPGLDLEDDDIADAMGELANILGGNLKALLPEGSTLTLPSVSSGPTGGTTDARGSGEAVVASVLWGDHLVTATVSSGAPNSGVSSGAQSNSAVPSSAPTPAPEETHP